VARRVSLPAADDLFRPTGDGDEEPAVRAVPKSGDPDGKRRTSGRVRHDEKMTVYVTSAELIELEHARLSLRSNHGLAVDRGRIVREAVALILADLDAEGEDSALVRRLSEG
jgi:hypothetical protein